ncbi:MAG TPA: hypothetical protein VJB87_05595 [Candidatus Nanoarchaeia archaeon]|nr:hypothetical protein [Candidatus Nanoarchaeia archaeon]
MVNITLAVPDALHKRMQQHTEIRWSEVARLSIEERLRILESMDIILKKSKLTPKDIREISRNVKKETLQSFHA